MAVQCTHHKHILLRPSIFYYIYVQSRIILIVYVNCERIILTDVSKRDKNSCPDLRNLVVYYPSGQPKLVPNITIIQVCSIIWLHSKICLDVVKYARMWWVMMCAAENYTNYLQHTITRTQANPIKKKMQGQGRLVKLRKCYEHCTHGSERVNRRKVGLSDRSSGSFYYRLEGLFSMKEKW